MPRINFVHHSEFGNLRLKPVTGSRLGSLYPTAWWLEASSPSSTSWSLASSMPLQPASQNIFPSVPAQVPATDSQLQKHFFGTLNSGWTVVPDSLDVRWYQGRWSGKLSLISGTVPLRLSVSFTMCGGLYRLAAPKVAKSSEPQSTHESAQRTMARIPRFSFVSCVDTASGAAGSSLLNTWTSGSLARKKNVRSSIA
jgi:hypothetical protein